MSAQTRYYYNNPIGAAGGLVDLSPVEIDTFSNEEENAKMKFAMGVVRGTDAGKQIKLPVAASTASVFEGIVTNNRTRERDLDGELFIRKNSAVGVLRYGKIYARLAEGVTPAYGDNVYLVKSGDDAGCFTNTAGETAVQVKGRFIGAKDTVTGVAPVELFNEAQA